MFNFGMPELVVILILALVLFGPGKLPEVGKAVGKSINEFKRASRDIEKELSGDDAEQDKEAGRSA